MVGPVEAKLISFPDLRRWVIGAWGEASEDLHILVKDVAKARAKHQLQLEGRWRQNRRSEEGGRLFHVEHLCAYTQLCWFILSMDIETSPEIQ